MNQYNSIDISFNGKIEIQTEDERDNSSVG